jgi:chromosome partitioning protein
MAGLIVTVAQQKGGAGKTTLAVHLALVWAMAKRVAVIDIDPQGSLAAWFRLRQQQRDTPGSALDVAAITGWRVSGEVERQAREHDIVVIDSAPHAETEARLAVRASSLVLIPVQPSPMDVWATRATLDLARQENAPALMVMNRVPARAKLTRAMTAKLAEFGAPIAATQIGNRVALAAALAEGEGILDAAPTSRAAAEMTALAAEILEHAARRDAA